MSQILRLEKTRVFDLDLDMESLRHSLHKDTERMKNHSSLTAYLPGHLLGTYHRRSAETTGRRGLSNWIPSYHSQLPIVGLVGLKTVSPYNKSP